MSQVSNNWLVLALLIWFWALGGIFAGLVVASTGGAYGLSLVFRIPANRLYETGMLLIYMIPPGMVAGGVASVWLLSWLRRHRPLLVGRATIILTALSALLLLLFSRLPPFGSG